MSMSGMHATLPKLGKESRISAEGCWQSGTLEDGPFSWRVQANAVKVAPERAVAVEDLMLAVC